MRKAPKSGSTGETTDVHIKRARLELIVWWPCYAMASVQEFEVSRYWSAFHVEILQFESTLVGEIRDMACLHPSYT